MRRYKMSEHDQIREIDFQFWNHDDQSGEIHIYYDDGTSEVVTDFESVVAKVTNQYLREIGGIK
jgi:hypothetical protein